MAAGRVLRKAWRHLVASRPSVPGSLLLLAIACAAPVAHAGEHAPQAARCIAENSGAASLECLEKTYWQAQGEIRRMEAAIIARLARERKAGTLTASHHEMAVSSLRDAARQFDRFSARQCDFAQGASGAVASGGGQVRWSCLIELADWRIQYLGTRLPGS